MSPTARIIRPGRLVIEALARPPLPSLVLIAGWALALELTGPYHGVVLAVTPFLLLLASLAAGRYPGEAALTRLRDRLASGRPWRHAHVGLAPTRSTPCAPLGRGGLLLGSSLASRAPPVARLADGVLPSAHVV